MISSLESEHPANAQEITPRHINTCRRLMRKPRSHTIGSVILIRQPSCAGTSIHDALFLRVVIAFVGAQHPRAETVLELDLVTHIGDLLRLLIFPAEVRELLLIPAIGPFEVVPGEPLSLHSRQRTSAMAPSTIR